MFKKPSTRDTDDTGVRLEEKEMNIRVFTAYLTIGFPRWLMFVAGLIASIASVLFAFFAVLRVPYLIAPLSILCVAFGCAIVGMLSAWVDARDYARAWQRKQGKISLNNLHHRAGKLAGAIRKCNTGGEHAQIEAREFLNAVLQFVGPAGEGWGAAKEALAGASRNHLNDSDYLVLTFRTDYSGLLFTVEVSWRHPITFHRTESYRAYIAN